MASLLTYGEQSRNLPLRTALATHRVEQLLDASTTLYEGPNADATHHSNKKSRCRGTNTTDPRARRYRCGTATYVGEVVR